MFGVMICAVAFILSGMKLVEAIKKHLDSKADRELTRKTKELEDLD